MVLKGEFKSCKEVEEYYTTHSYLHVIWVVFIRAILWSHHDIEAAGDFNCCLNDGDIFNKIGTIFGVEEFSYHAGELRLEEIVVEPVTIKSSFNFIYSPFLQTQSNERVYFLRKPQKLCETRKKSANFLANKVK